MSRMDFARERGLSLVELLVSMAVAAIVLAGVISVFSSSVTSFKLEQESAFIQENARFAVELLSRDIRSAGDMGCAHADHARIANVVDEDVDGLFSAEAVSGDDSATGTWPAAIDAAKDHGSDAIVVRFAEPESEVHIDSHDENNATLTTFEDPNLDFEENEKLILVNANCGHVGIFEASSLSSSSNVAEIGHAASGDNCTNVLLASVGSFDCGSAPCEDDSCGGNGLAAFRKGSALMRYIIRAYYVDEIDSLNMPVLLRRSVTANGHRAEELAQGVELMLLRYGEDTDADPDGEIDVFRKAEDVADWARVLSVRFTLVMRSQSAILDDPATVTVDGEQYPETADRFLRQVITSTVRIRSRG